MKTNSATDELVIKHIPLTELKAYKNNPRTHSAKQIKQIANSIGQFGFTNPILIGNDKQIIAGHGRVLAAQELKMEVVPTICLSNLDDNQKRAYIIADNKLAENAGWDTDLLKLELSYLDKLDIDFDLTITGFSTTELDLLLNELDYPSENTDYLNGKTDPICTPGDLWQLGDHKILCADSRSPDAYRHLLGLEKAQLIFIDPPYNVPIDGHVCGAGTIKHANFAMAAGEMTSLEFTNFLENIFVNLINFSVSGSIHYVAMDWRHIKELISAADCYTELKNLCVWNKNNGGMGSLYRSKHELIFVFKNGDAPHINNINLGKDGRYRTNVWDYEGVNTFKKDRMEELASHPTVKPIPLVADAILDCSNRNDIVLDCFGGSGTTLIAAEQTKRRARLIEIDPHYVDITIKRFEKITGQKALKISNANAFGGDYGG